jgi:hypothetical protein
MRSVLLRSGRIFKFTFLDHRIDGILDEIAESSGTTNAKNFTTRLGFRFPMIMESGWSHRWRSGGGGSFAIC